MCPLNPPLVQGSPPAALPQRTHLGRGSLLQEFQGCSFGKARPVPPSAHREVTTVQERTDAAGSLQSPALATS